MFQASVLGRAQFPRRLLQGGLGDDAGTTPPDSSSWISAIGTDINSAAAAVTGGAANASAGVAAGMPQGSSSSPSAFTTVANDITSIANAFIGANAPKTPVPTAPKATTTPWYGTWWGIGALGLGGLAAFHLIRRVI